jgi:hypothetical protein
MIENSIKNKPYEKRHLERIIFIIRFNSCGG